MRQETIVKTYLNFNELTEVQKNKVIEQNYDINIDHAWYEHLEDDFKNKLKSLGFYLIEVEFSGFSSQGDGARFSANHKKGNVEVSGYYHHSNSMRSDNSILLQVAKRLANEYYRQLNDTYDYLTSREAIIETIEANEMEFDKDKVS